MANLGAIGVLIDRTLGSTGRVYAGSTTTKSVSGQVTVLGSATSGLIVRAYAKNNGEFLGQAVTDGSGNYSIHCGTVTDVYVIAFDPNTYQALVYDRVAPG